MRIKLRVGSGSSVLDRFADEVFEVDGVRFLNCTPHELRLDDGRVVRGNPELARILAARAIERTVERRPPVEFVTTTFETTDEGEKLCEEAAARGIFLVGSIIAAQAYGYPAVSPVTTPETSRKPPAERIVFSTKWNCYWK